MTDYTKMTDLQLEVADAKAREDLAAAFAARRNIMIERERRGLRLVDFLQEVQEETTAQPDEDGPDDGGFYREDDGAQFALYYAKCARTTVAELRRQGRYPERCRCGMSYCQGWNMGHQHEDALAENEQRGTS